MSNQRGILLTTLPAEAADKVDYLTSRYQITPEQAICACVAAMVGMIEQRDQRALAFMQMVHDNAHRGFDDAANLAAAGGVARAH